MIVTIIGTGLIGGSLALALKQTGIATKIFGVDSNAINLQRAVDLNLVDKQTNLDEAVKVSDLVVLSVPVDNAEAIIKKIMPKVNRQVIMDVGSTKKLICHVASNMQGRSRFVATHPMWGTEYSGPDAAMKGAFKGKAVVICEKEKTDLDALELVEDLYHRLGMHKIYMSPADHDLHAAYVSHISHISSFALANTVLEKEKEDNTIFEMASGGFESTVRLAKSNLSMWVPIFMENRENLLDVLNEHISQLRKFKSCLEKENSEYLAELISNANRIRKIIN